MTQPSSRPPNLLQPRLKAAPTFSSSILAATASTTPQVSRASSRTREPDIERPLPPVDTSDKTTASLIRRILRPHTHSTGDRNIPRPISEILPPLTSSNDVDLQLYAIIAIVIKEFVFSWYAKITPDHVFVEEVVRIIAHCTRALEGRLRGVDLEELLLDEIPELVERHVLAYRTAHEPMQPPPLRPEARQVYHTLCPHPALSPIPNPEVPSTVNEQQQNEAAYCQLLVQGVLAVLLPTEDLENVCLRTLVTDVLGELILRNGIGGKACEGWFIWDAITKIVENIKARVESKASGAEIEIDTRSRLEKSGLLSTHEDSNTGTPGRRLIIPSSVSTICWRILQYGYLAFIAIRFVILGLYTASSLPSRSSSSANTSSHPSISSPIAKAADPLRITSAQRSKRPMVTMRIWSLASHVVDLADRMPWLTGSLSLLQYHLLTSIGRVGATDGLLDKFLSQTIHTNLLTPTHLAPILLSLRTTLFPHNTLPLSPPRPSSTPTPTQTPTHNPKLKCATSILALLPPPIARLYFSTADAKLQKKAIEERTLDVFGDAYLNKHLLYAIVELLLVRLVPEVGQSGVGELMEARLG